MLTIIAYIILTETFEVLTEAFFQGKMENIICYLILTVKREQLFEL